MQAKKCVEQIAEGTDKTSRTQREQPPGHSKSKKDKDDWDTKKYTQKMSAQAVIGDEQHLWEGLQYLDTSDPEEEEWEKTQKEATKTENISEWKTCEACWTTAPMDKGGKQNTASPSCSDMNSSKDAIIVTSFQRVKTPLSKEFRDEKRRERRDDKAIGIPLTRPEEEDCKRNKSPKLGQSDEAWEKEKRRILEKEGVENPWACKNPISLNQRIIKKKGKRFEKTTILYTPCVGCRRRGAKNAKRSWTLRLTKR